MQLERTKEKSMKRSALIGMGLIMTITLFGCLSHWLDPSNLAQLQGHESAISVAEAVAGSGDIPSGDVPVVATSVEIYGLVSAFGELFCPCFEFSSDDASIVVKYALFPEEAGYSDVSVEGIGNGDWVLVVGTLRTVGQLPLEIWATEILLIQ
jgi:hypothetical protein